MLMMLKLIDNVTKLYVLFIVHIVIDWLAFDVIGEFYLKTAILIIFCKSVIKIETISVKSNSSLSSHACQLQKYSTRMFNFICSIFKNKNKQFYQNLAFFTKLQLGFFFWIVSFCNKYFSCDMNNICFQSYVMTYSYIQ